MVEIGHGLPAKITFGPLEEELMILQGLEYRADMAQVICPGRAINQYIIEKDNDEPAQKWLEHVVHEGLERCQGVGEAEGHDEELEQTLMSAERCFLDVVRVHAHLVVPRAHVELREEFGTAEFVEQLLDHRYGELVFDRDHVERPVVDAEPPRVVPLFD